MSMARSFAFDVGRETIETPSVRTTSDIQRRIPSMRPSMMTLKKAVVII
jgi:hypothetical protein